MKRVKLDQKYATIVIQRISLAADVLYKIEKSDFGIHTEAVPVLRQ